MCLEFSARRLTASFNIHSYKHVIYPTYIAQCSTAMCIDNNCTNIVNSWCNDIRESLNNGKYNLSFLNRCLIWSKIVLSFISFLHNLVHWGMLFYSYWKIKSQILTEVFPKIRQKVVYAKKPTEFSFIPCS